MKRIIISLLALVVIVALWSGAWLFAAGQIKSYVASAAQSGDPETLTLECADLSVAGFPFRFDVTCANARIAQADITMALPQIKATTLVYNPTHFIAFADGPARIEDAFYGTAQELRWELLEASLRLNGWQLARLSIEGDAVSWVDTLIGETEIFKSPRIEAHLIDLPDRHNDENKTSDLALYLKADQADMPLQNISGADVKAEAEITQLPDDIRLYGDPALPRLWQAQGGALKIIDISAVDPQSEIHLQGDLTLSETGEVNGSVAIRSQNVAQRFGAILDPQIRTLFFGPQQADGENLQNINIIRGTVFTGILPMGTIPPLF